ncbi:MAG: DUF1553 domain-containing protein [Planctomycetes bacterium]|nr:DUF1553 domain-containing protein [Planctomycetota bacterium]
MAENRQQRRNKLTVAALLLCGWCRAASAEPPVAPPTSLDADVERLAEKIDELISRRWRAEQVTPARPVDDASFIRRVSLDIAGKIPAVADLHLFLEDTQAGKRQRLVDSLLESPAYITHFSNVWRAVMLPEAETELEVRILVPNFEAWLRRQASANTGFDAVVREILTVSVDPRLAANPLQPQTEVTPVGFYQAKQLKPENLAAGTARMFLGVRIECAQCHDHPFDDWKREQFWGYAAFFAGLERDPNGAGALDAIKELFGGKTVTIPGTEKKVVPTYLDGQAPQLKFRDSPRSILANWVVSEQNAYFARATVNRVWGQFFGIGIVSPVDDFTAANPPSHPELLDELAEQFVTHNYDFKFLIRAITSSKTYQLSSQETHKSQSDPRLFARMSIKGLTAEQLFDSISQATGFHEPTTNRNQFALMNNSPREEFVQLFMNSNDAVVERQTTILQALSMMNGQFVVDATGLEKSATLTAIAEFPLMTTAERVEALYLAALSREPRPDELDRLVAYVDAGGPAKYPKQALSDVFWALLNCSEFLFNR